MSKDNWNVNSGHICMYIHDKYSLYKSERFNVLTPPTNVGFVYVFNNAINTTGTHVEGTNITSTCIYRPNTIAAYKKTIFSLLL